MAESDQVRTESDLLVRAGVGSTFDRPAQMVRDLILTMFDRTGLAVSAKTASYTVTLADDRATIEVNSATDVDVTIPTNSTVPFPAGAEFDIIQTGAIF